MTAPLRSQTHLLRWVSARACNAPDLAVELLWACIGVVHAECWRPAAAPADSGGTSAGDCFHFQPRPWCTAATIERLAAARERTVRAHHVVDATLPPLALALQGM